MDDSQREFLDELLTTPSPTGYETAGQRVWIDYVSKFADDVQTDEYGNAVATVEGGEPEIAIAGHADEIGFLVRRIDDDGFVQMARLGGSDRTVTRGQHVTIHGEEPVSGVVGQNAIHLRDAGKEEYDEIREQRIDIGAEDGEAARELVEVGDPITFSSTIEELQGSLVAARGMDNRVGTFVAAETLRAAAEADVDATIHAVSTVQEEVGLKGAQMVGFDLDPDAAIAVDVTHATDYPNAPSDRAADVELGGGPVVSRGTTNHPVVVEAVREAADDADVDVQLEAAGIRTGTDADAFFVQRGGIPSLNVGLPNRYMHTPVEVVDTEDLTASVELLAAFAERASEYEAFAVDV
ncbi:M20/M25/M40 family metallo-hydrolase [Natranaeroarchaeum aerophilus]|uniref:M20/M25/M40 family metallo-hydrolase n=1 Tax=Natranaeroarchaeum aerophilus TaxID=2917711 RepID=A0AAE3FQZ7_9EURY|nr:M20/M25/M40 family metallo-hydrolase [Natranaeroarchaeum aerophilus]MCL9813728.1 M20/M25/M40 family metallo-hydrolase [Natranaeroarchaeum aerophilus]